MAHDRSVLLLFAVSRQGHEESVRERHLVAIVCHAVALVHHLNDHLVDLTNNGVFKVARCLHEHMRFHLT
jgi:hypothetical protein